MQSDTTIMDNGANVLFKGRGLHVSHPNLRSKMNKHDLLKIQLEEMGLNLLTFSEFWFN